MQHHDSHGKRSAKTLRWTRVTLALLLVLTLIPVLSAVTAPKAKAYSDYTKNYTKEWHYDAGTTFLKDFALGWGNATGAGSPYSAGTVRSALEGIGTRIDKDFNDGAGGYYVYIAYRTTTNPAEAVTGVMIEDANNRAAKSYGGSTWYAANSGDHDWVPYLYGSSNGEGAVDLNKDAGGDYLFLYVTKDPNYGAPILGSVTQQTGKGKTSKSGYTVVRSFQDPNNAIDLNKDAGGDFIYLFYQNPTATQVNSDTLRAWYKWGKKVNEISPNYSTALNSALDTASTILADLNDGYTTYTQTDINNTANAIKAIADAMPGITLNTETTANIPTGGSGAWFTFTPSTTATYIFEAKGTVGDPKGYIINGAGEQIAYQDDVSNSTNGAPKAQALLDISGNRHYIVQELTAGVKYYLCSRHYSSGTTGNYPVVLANSRNITFNATGGATTFTQALPQGQTVHMDKSGLTRDGHELIAWSTSGSNSEDKHCLATETKTVPTSNTTYYALWYPTNAPTLVPNNDYTATIDAASEIEYYQFTPQENRKYLIYGKSSTDSYLLFYDAQTYHTDATYLEKQDDSYNDNGNNTGYDFGLPATNQFFLLKELEAGTTYLYGVKYYGSSNTGDIPFRFEEVYNVSYNMNGGSGEIDAQDKFLNKDLTLSSTEPTREHATFLGWSTDPNATAPEYAKGGAYTANADAVLYAVWQIETHTVTFKNWDGTELKTEEVDYGSNATPPADPTRDADDTYHYQFDGWNADDYTNVTEDKEITATYTPGEHTGEWTGNTATCTEGGTETRTCPTCGKVQTRSTTPLGHQMTHNAAVPAEDCQHTGVVEYYRCSRCEKNFADEQGTTVITDLDDHTPGDHKPVTDAAVPATCTDPGKTEGSHCELCGTVLVTQETVNALGHAYGEWERIAEPTCTAEGAEKSVCGRCGEEITRPVPALGHDWSAWETVTPATYTEDGLERRICFRCTEIETRVLPKIDAPKDRKVQFAVSGDMHFVVHMPGYDYLIYSRTTKVLEWYSSIPLTFEVVTDYGWKYDSFTVLVNQVELAPNADGSYTLPAGKDFTIISVVPVEDLPAIDDINPDDGSTPSSGSGVCKLCGKTHPSHIWGRIIAFFHAVIYFFKHLFG